MSVYSYFADKQAILFGEEHGFPVAVKASAGGGGKGFAVAGDASEAENAFARASREGEAYSYPGGVFPAATFERFYERVDPDSFEP